MARRVQEIYDRAAPDWDVRQGAAERGLIGPNLRRGVARELGGDVLEIGAGTGATFHYLDASSPVTSYTAVDLSRGMLGVARKKCPVRRVDVAQMNAEHLAFADAIFDTVTTSLMLCTVADPVRALQEMVRVCNPDGKIVLLEHVRARNPLLYGLQRLLSPLQERRLGCHLHRETDLLVKELGFRIEREETRFFGVFHLIVARPPLRT